MEIPDDLDRILLFKFFIAALRGAEKFDEPLRMPEMMMMLRPEEFDQLAEVQHDPALLADTRIDIIKYGFPLLHRLGLAVFVDEESIEFTRYADEFDWLAAFDASPDEAYALFLEHVFSGVYEEDVSDDDYYDF